MTWFDQLKQALPAYYRPDRPAEIVGYLRGSGEPSVWRQMEAIQHRHQMLILGNVEPTNEEWGHAGVAQRGGTQVVTIDKLTGLIVLYGGFMLNRPWGEIHSQTPDAITIGFPAALKSWQRNYRPPKY